MLWISDRQFVVVSLQCFEGAYKELSGAMVSRLDYCAGDQRSIPSGAEFPTGIQFWVMT